MLLWVSEIQTNRVRRCLGEAMTRQTRLARHEGLIAVRPAWSGLQV